jgi:putative ABC transport system permease protein
VTIARVIRAVLVRALPARVAIDAVDDLLEDHRRIRLSRGPLSATLFLIREASSLLSSRIADAATRLLKSPVVWRRDLTHAIRAVVRRPWSSVSAILMLAVGLAAVAASAGLASALLFRSISAKYPGEVTRLASVDVAGRTRLAFSEPELERVREHLLGSEATLAVANLQPVVLRTADTDTQTLAEVIGGRYFDVIGLDVAVGRPLVEGDARAGAPPVMVISDTLWRDRFGRDPAAVGATLRLNGRAFTIVGVTSGTSTSSLLGGSVDAWITVAHADAMLDRDWRTNSERRWWTTIVHFKPGAGSPQFEALLGRATADLAAQLPDQWRARRLITVPGTVLTGSQRTAAATLSLVLSVFAALILAAAAANAGGVFLAAAAAERGRAAIQLAIGSGRGAILRRHLMEGAILGSGGGIAALALYAWVRRQLADVALLPTLSLRLDLPFDARIAVLTIGAGALAGVLLALGPSLWMMRLDLAQTLRDGSGRSAGGAGLSKTRRLLVAAQVAISIALVAGASLFARSMETLATLDVGFPRHGLIAMDFDLEPSAPAAMLPVLAREALDRAQAIPGVVAASMASRAPIDSSTPRLAVNVPGSSGRALDDVTFYAVTERYFDTIGLPIVRGRAFTAADGARANDVVIVNETLARQLWPEGDALDRPLVLPAETRTVRVVGIARDSKYRSLSEAPRPHLYRPAAPGFSLALLVRTHDDPRRTILAVQEVLDRIGPGVVGFFPRTLDDHLSIDMLTTRASARASATLGAFALILSAAGLYGIVMWFVEVRRREIGVRLALGASANQVRRLVVRQAVVAAAPGVAIGLVMAIALTAFGRSLFVGIDAIDPVSLLIGIVTLGAIVLAASYLPSRRATQVDPVIVLRDS